MAETEKKVFDAYDGTKITFYPNSHRYQRAGEKTYLLSPSAIVGVIDKSNALQIWNERLIFNFFLTKGLDPEVAKKSAREIEVRYEARKSNGEKVTFFDVGREVMAEHLPTIENFFSYANCLDYLIQALGQRTIKLDEAKDVGSEIHDFAEAYAYLQVMGEVLPTRESIESEIHYDEQVKQGKLAFLDLVKENEIEFVDVERFVYGYVENFNGQKIWYSGKFDVKMKVMGRRVLGDWKSSKGVYTSQKYQLGGYDIAEQQAIEYFKRHGQDTTDLEYEAIVVIHIDKNTGISTIHELSQEEREDCHDAFKAATILKMVEKKLDKWQK